MKGDWNNLKIANEAAYRAAEEIDYGGAGRECQRFYVHVPRTGSGFPATVWFHGGGLISDGREVPDCLFDGRMAVIEARYRLSPDFPAPAALSDAAAAVARVLADAAKYRIDPERVFLGGMSAGAYLAAMVGMDGGYLAAHGFACRELAGLLLVSGQMTTHFHIEHEKVCLGQRWSIRLKSGQSEVYADWALFVVPTPRNRRSLECAA